MFMSDGLWGTLEGKDYRSLDMELPSVAAFLNRCIEMSETSTLTTERTLESGLLHKVYLGSGKLSWTEVELQNLIYKRNHFKKTVVDTFPEHCGIGIFTLKLHLLDRVVGISMGLARSMF